MSASSSGEMNVNHFAHEFGKKFQGHNAQSHYGRCIPVIQSSGKGKSRLMDEVSYRIPLATVVLRDKPDDGFPLGDASVYDYFFKGKPQDPEEQAAAFLGAWLEAIVENFAIGNSPREWLHTWTQSPSSKPDRQAAFQAVVARAESFWASDSDVLNGLRAKRGTLSELSFTTEWYSALFKAYCLEATEKLILLLDAQSDKSNLATRHAMKLCIDECSMLNVISAKHDDLVKRGKATGYVSSLISLQRIVTAQDSHLQGHKFALWFTCLDTNSSVTDFYPENERVASSTRQAVLRILPPWTSFDFDLHWPPRDKLSKKSPKEVLDLDFLKKSGRPLWNACDKQQILSIAKIKLLGHHTFNPDVSNQVFAVLSHRVVLDLGDSEEASIMAKDAIKSHMRVMLNLVGRSHVKTECPSEPILAIAASQALLPSESRDTYRAAMRVLIKRLISKDVVVERGRKGELCAQLLLIMSIDLAIKRPIAVGLRVETTTLDHLLQKMLGETLGLPPCKPDSEAAQTRKEMMNEFAQLHINVTHVEQQYYDLGEICPEFLLQLWCRGAAAQCTFNQAVIDMLIPAYAGSLNEPFNLKLLTYFVIQVKAKARAASKSLLETLTGPRIRSYDNKKTVIQKPKNHLVILLDLCAKSSFKKRKEPGSDNIFYATELTYAPARVPKPSEHGAHWNGYMPSGLNEPERYCLNVRGCSPETYKVLAELGIEEAWGVLFQHTYNHDAVVLQGPTDDMVAQLHRDEYANPAPQDPPN